LKLFHDARNFKLNTGNNGPIGKSARPLLGVVLLYVSNPSLYAFWIGVAGEVTAMVCSKRLLASYFICFFL